MILKKAKFTVILSLLVLVALFPQTISAQPWSYDFGTATGTANNSNSGSGNTTFFPSTPTGGGTYRVRIGTQGGSLVLANPGTSLGSETEAQLTAATGASTNKFTVYGWNNPSTQFYFQFKMRTTSSTNGILVLHIGSGASGTIYQDNNSYTNYLNSITTLQINYLSGAITSVQRYQSGGPQSITGHGILKDSDQVLEFYANNASTSTTYVRSGNNTLNSQCWDMWVGGVKISPSGGWPKSSTWAAGNTIGGFGFFAESSISNSAVIYLDDLIYSNAFPSITVSPSTLSGFNYAAGSGPSDVQSFTVSGTNLYDNITLNASTNYEISETQNANYTNQIILAMTNGVVPEKTIYARLKSGLSQGTYNEHITASSTGVINQITCNGVVLAQEPLNHVSGVSAAANSYNSITISWTDSDAEFYLVKGSKTSYEAIVAPVDGVAESDGLLVKNVAKGNKNAVQFAGLDASSTYYFKIFPYNGTGAYVNFKTNEPVPQAQATTYTPNFVVGDFGFIASSGNWGTTNTNWKQWDGSGWNTTPSGVPTTNDNVWILSGKTCIVEVSGKNAKNLFVEQGAKLYANNTTMGSPRYINVTGNITCDGTIGNGNGNDDVISFNINGSSCVISGGGSITINRLAKNVASQVSLTISTNMEVRFNGIAIVNNYTATGLLITVERNAFLNLTGNGALPNGEYWLYTNDVLTLWGKMSLTGNIVGATTTTRIIIKSDEQTTGSLIPKANNVLSGTMERYIPGYDSKGSTGWHLLSSPVNNFPIAGSNFEPGNQAPNLDDFYAWDEVNYEWLNYKVPGNNLTYFVNGRGYLVAYQSTNQRSFSGTFNTANITHNNLTRTVDKGFGWHLLGNPFQSALKWEAANWNLNNIANGAKIMNPGGTYEDITYLGENQHIPANQGFFVQALVHNNNSITIPVASRTHNATPFYKNSIANLLTLKASDGEFYVKTWIQLHEDATSGFDQNYDVPFLSGVYQAPQLYSVVNENVKLSTNLIGDFENEVIIPLRFKSYFNREFTLSALNADSFDDGIDVFLLDATTGKQINLKEINTYTFFANANELTNRFSIILLKSNSISEPNTQTNTNLRIYSYDRDIYLTAPTSLDALISVYNLVGQQVYLERVKVNGQYQFRLEAPSGWYVVKVNTNQRMVSQKIFIR